MICYWSHLLREPFGNSIENKFPKKWLLEDPTWDQNLGLFAVILGDEILPNLMIGNLIRHYTPPED